MTWTDGTLGDFLTLKRGHDLPNGSRIPGDIPVVSSSGITGWHNEAKAEPPGVVTGRYGTIGEVYFVGHAYWPLNTALYVIDFKGNDPRFIAYFLRQQLKNYQSDKAAVPGVDRKVLHKLPARCPDPQLQQRIVRILAGYDDLIENNQRRIALLETASQQIYKEWFTRLRFPGHEHVKIVDGVPEGWQRMRLSTLLDTQYGYTETATLECVGPKFLRGTDINKHSYIDWSTVPYCPAGQLDFEKYALSPGDILVIRMADPGKVAIVEQEIEAVFASYLIRLTRKEGVSLDPLYIFYALSDPAYQGFVSGASGGATRKSANAKLVVDFEIMVPPDQIVAQFVDEVAPGRRLTQNLLRTNAILRSARDLLLPRLMSGAIPV